MKKITNLQDLLLEQAQELHDAIAQEQKELNIIAKNATSYALKEVINKQLLKANKQDELLKAIFEKLQVTPAVKHDTCCAAILKTTHSFISRSNDTTVRDAAIINGLQRINHAKIAGFGSLAAYLREVGESDLSYKCHWLVEQERDIDEALTTLAEKKINHKAMVELV